MPYMPSKSSNPRAYLFHIRDNIILAETFIDGFDYERFRDNLLVFYAVTRALEIISEARSDIPKSRGPMWPAQEAFIGMTTRTCGRTASGSLCKRTSRASERCWNTSFFA